MQCASARMDGLRCRKEIVTDGAVVVCFALQIEVITMDKQLTYFENTKSQIVNLIGPAATDELITNALFSVTMGSNDYLNNYFLPASQRAKNFTPKQYQDIVINKYRGQLQVSAHFTLWTSHCLSIHVLIRTSIASGSDFLSPLNECRNYTTSERGESSSPPWGLWGASRTSWRWGWGRTDSAIPRTVSSSTSTPLSRAWCRSSTPRSANPISFSSMLTTKSSTSSPTLALTVRPNHCSCLPMSSMAAAAPVHCCSNLKSNLIHLYACIESCEIYT